jgi:hypothetical protein
MEHRPRIRLTAAEPRDRPVEQADDIAVRIADGLRRATAARREDQIRQLIGMETAAPAAVRRRRMARSGQCGPDVRVVETNGSRRVLRWKPLLQAGGRQHERWSGIHEQARETPDRQIGIQRHVDGAGAKGAEYRDDEIGRRLEHQGDPIFGTDAGGGEIACEPAGTCREIGVGERFLTVDNRDVVRRLRRLP